MKKKMISILLAAAMVMSLAACGSSEKETEETSSEASEEQVLRLSGGNPETLDSIIGTGGDSVTVIREVQEGLVRFNKKDGQDVLEPAGAESWETSEDGLTWTFKLREHYWSDGE